MSIAKQSKQFVAHYMCYKRKHLKYSLECAILFLLFIPCLLKAYGIQYTFWTRSIRLLLCGSCFFKPHLLTLSPADQVSGKSSNSRCSFTPAKLRASHSPCLECSPHVPDTAQIHFSRLTSVLLNIWMNEQCRYLRLLGFWILETIYPSKQFF